MCIFNLGIDNINWKNLSKAVLLSLVTEKTTEQIEKELIKDEF